MCVCVCVYAGRRTPTGREELKAIIGHDAGGQPMLFRFRPGQQGCAKSTEWTLQRET